MKWKRYRFTTVKSTNLTAAALLRDGENENFLVTADMQTGGKGRKSRMWDSPHGGCCASFVFFPPDSFSEYQIFPLVAGCAAQKCCRFFSSGSEWVVKWPNDVLCCIGGLYKKAGGILCELELEPKTAVIIGIGINLSGKFQQRTDLLQPAVAIEETGVNAPQTEEFIQMLSERISDELNDVQKIGVAPYINSRQSLFLHDVFAELLEENGNKTGIISGIAPDGAMLFKIGEKVISVYSGDVKLKE